ncbi:UNVERIFIED_CONTAM: pilus assembly protein CpaB [Acetivibrio alkalicellulosi]
MESVNKRVILISLILAVFTTGLVYLYIKSVTTVTETVEYINVYVAAKTLPAQHMVTEQDIKVSKVTREYLSSKAVLNPADIIGKRVMDRIIEGEQILWDRLAEEEELAPAFRLPHGKRAVALNVNEQTAVGYLIKPGDMVDVIGNFGNPDISRTIIQNVQVIATGQYMQGDEGKPGEAHKTVTLSVSPQEAEKISFITEFASIRLVLRNIEDESNINTDGIIREDLTGSKGIEKNIITEIAP